MRFCGQLMRFRRTAVSGHHPVSCTTHLQQEGARPAGQVAAAICGLPVSQVLYSHNSTFMFTFTYLQEVLFQFAPDSYSLMKPARVTVTRVLVDVSNKFDVSTELRFRENRRYGEMYWIEIFIVLIQM